MAPFILDRQSAPLVRTSPRGRPMAGRGAPRPACLLRPLSADWLGGGCRRRGRSRARCRAAARARGAMSSGLSKLGSGPLPRRLLARYLLLLRLYPVLTKAATSAFLSALGSLLSQIIEKRRKKRSLDWQEPLRFAVYGFLFTGPLSHYFYLYLEQLMPSGAPLALIKRLLVDRLVISPAFLALFFLVMNFLEGKDMSAFSRKIKSGYWAALKMNWKVWTPVQVINFTYVPLQFQVLFGNLVALFWFTYLASLKK